MAKRLIVRGARRGQLVLAKDERSCGGESGALQFVRGLVLGIVALHGKRQRSMCGVFGGQVELDLVGVLCLGAKLQGFGVGVAVVVTIAEVRQVELTKRQGEIGFFLGPVEEVRLGDVVRHGKRLAGRGRIADLQIRDVAAHSGVYVFDHALPLRFGDAAEDGTQHEFFIAAEGVVHVGFEFADLVDFSVDLGNLAVGHGRVGGRLLEMGRAVGGNDQRQLVAQTEGQQAEGSNFAGGIHPDFFVRRRHGQQGDHVIELRGRRHVGIELAAGVDQYRRRMQALGFEQGGKQGVLVFAVAVLVVKNVSGSVGLVAAHAERQADVAEILRDVVVETPGPYPSRC